VNIFDGGEEAAAVARSNAAKHNRALDAERNAAWQARQDGAKQAERNKLANWIKDERPGASALKLADHNTPEWRAAQAQARAKTEKQREQEAVALAANPPVKDPRTSAQKLVDGAGQSRLDL
jgi:hypothetical protein